MPVSIRFSRRPGYDTLQVRITVDGLEGSPFSTLADGKTFTIGGSWDQKKQKRTDRTDAATKTNVTLSALFAAIAAVCDRQRSAGLVPTPKTVQKEYQTGERAEEVMPPEPAKPEHTLLDIYRSQIITLLSWKGTENQLTQSTVDKWEYGLTYLEEYLKSSGQINLQVNYISVGWFKAYHLHLQKSGPMSVDSATRYIKKISEAIDSWVDYGTRADARFNPIAGTKFGRDKTKDVYFLLKPHLEKFWQLDNRGKAGECIWWMGLVFLTGLDYPDAVWYIQNREKCDKPGNKRPSIEIRRSKPPKAACKIPVWPELTALLQHVPPGTPPTADEINGYMKGVEVLIGFEHRLTLKIGRKTAGYIFLLRGYSITAVSRILGHSDIAVTQRYYVRVTAELVEQETDRL